MKTTLTLLPLIATIAMTMLSPMDCRAESTIEKYVQNKCCSADKDDDNKVHLVVENLPEFPGGQRALMDYLRNEIRYPQQCVKNKIEGRSIITFVVEKNGKVKNVKVTRTSGNKKLDKEAKRAVKNMPAWQPGRHQGKIVRVQYSIPIMFRLQNPTK